MINKYSTSFNFKILIWIEDGLLWVYSRGFDQLNEVKFKKKTYGLWLCLLLNACTVHSQLIIIII